MYRTLRRFQRSRVTHPQADGRTLELATLLVRALGYEEAVEQATQSNWHRVAETIQFMKSNSLQRF